MKTTFIITAFLFALFSFVNGTEKIDGESIIGLLTMPQVFGDAPCKKFEPKEIPVFPISNSKTPIATIRVDKMWAFPKEGGCEGLNVCVHRSDNSIIEKLPSEEYDYENPAVIVFEKHKDWYKIRLENGYGWVLASGDNTFLSLIKLFTSHTPYLTNAWDGRVWQLPNEGAKQVTRVRPETAVHVITSKLVNSELWIKIQLPIEDDCGKKDNSITPIQGWIPAHSKSKDLTLWFHSRGC